jgi:hypothetical protein
MWWWMATVLLILWVVWPALTWAILYDAGADHDGDLRIVDGQMQRLDGRRWRPLKAPRRGEDWWGEELTFGGRVRVGDERPTR